MIVLNYNGVRFLPDCLGSLESNLPHPGEVIVVDNGSTDGSLHYISHNHPWVKPLALKENRWFAGGNNAAVRASDSDFLIFLNNDTRVAPDWAEELLAPFEDGEVGAVTSSMRRFGEPSVMDSAGGTVDYLGYSRDFGAGEPAEKWSEPARILIPCGGAMAVRRSALEEPSRAFWNQLGIYSEDLDLGISMYRRGWKVVYQPGAVVEHHFSATTGRGSPVKVYYSTRNRLLVLRRHLSGKTWKSLAPTLASWQLMWLAFLLVHRRGPGFRPVLRGTLAGIREAVSLPFVSRAGDLSGEEVLLQHMEYSRGTGVRRRFCAVVRKKLVKAAEAGGEA